MCGIAGDFPAAGVGLTGKAFLIGAGVEERLGFNASRSVITGSFCQDGVGVGCTYLRNGFGSEGSGAGVGFGKP